ncbi:MAG: hypothetical protein V1861_03465 [Candidatus Micrarchaeota archaeon]
MKARCRHPYAWAFSLFNPGKCFLYMINSMISDRSAFRFLRGAVSTSAMLALLLTFAPYGRKAFFSMASLMVTGTYGKAAAEKLKCGFCRYLEKRRPDMPRLGPPISEKFQIGDAFGTAKSTLRKEVIIDNNSFLLAALACICAKKVFLHASSGKALLLADNGNLMLHVARLPLFSPAAALSAFVGMVFIPVKCLRTPSTLRFGL